MQIPKYTRVTPGKALIASPNVAVALSGVRQGCLGITVSALDSNQGSIYVGGPGMLAGTGIQLSPTNSIDLSIDDVSKIYIIGANVSEGVSFSYYN